MVKYIGPKVKITRRLGMLPGLTRKMFKLHKRKTPGEKGREVGNNIDNSTLKEDYKSCLFEKQKLRYNYGITESQLYYYYIVAKKSNNLTGIVLLELLESRLDAVLFRFGFSRTIPAARQLINHKHILINNKIVSTPSFICQRGDIISISKKSKKLINKFINAQRLRKELMHRKMLSGKITHNPAMNYLLTPSHLKIEENLLVGIFLNSPKRKDFPLEIDELKVIQYYSR